MCAVSGQTGGTNLWTKPTSGDWEEQAFWSLGVLPDATQSVVFTNTGWKALAIGADTAQNFPDSMNVQSLRVGAPVDSYNTLLMNWSGFERPLQTESFVIESNSAVVVHGSALEVVSTSPDGSTGNLLMGGTFIHSDYSQVKVYRSLSVRRFGILQQPWAAAPALYFLTNGILSVDGGISIGGMEGPGRFFQYGGSNNVGGLGVSPEGEYHLHDGEATATNGMTVGFGDFADSAIFFQYGGSLNADTVVNGNYVLHGGIIRGRMSGPSGDGRADPSVLQTGGTNFAVSLDLGRPDRFAGFATYVLSNGVLQVDSSFRFRAGRFSQYNGLHTIRSNLVMEGTDVGPGVASGDYFLEGGTLSAGGLSAQAATFQHTGGTNLIAGDLVLTSLPLTLGRPSYPAQYMLNGGFLSAGSIAVNHESILTVSNGVLNAGALAMNLPATGGVAVVNLCGGSIAVSNVIDIGLGNIVISGGNFQSPGINVFRGELRQSGGTNEMGAITLPRNRISIGQGNYYLSGGTLLSSTLSLGAGAPGGFAGLNGVFEQSGGVHSNSGGIMIYGTHRQAERRPNGEYRLSEGLLVTPSLHHPEGGAFIQTGGTNRAGILTLDDAATYLLGGGSIYSSNVVVGPGDGSRNYWSNLRSFYTQTGGSHVVAIQFSAIEGSVARLQGGSLTAPSITVGPDGDMTLSGAAVTNSGTFTLISGAWVRADGDYPQLGKLIVKYGVPPGWPPTMPGSLLDLGHNAATLRFQDSRDTTWDSSLVITNWSGSPNGGGTDRLYVGTSSQGLTPAQLARIRFDNPAGLPAGNYPAVILATGEVVPGSRPVLSMTHSSSGIVISWNGNSQLFTSTNVLGPFTVISGATSPYTNSFNEPHRFFFLRSP